MTSAQTIARWRRLKAREASSLRATESRIQDAITTSPVAVAIRASTRAELPSTKRTRHLLGRLDMTTM